MIRPRQTPAQLWSRPPSQPTLGEHDVDIWRAPLETHPMCVQRLIKLLSRDEIVRANEFYFGVDRDNFVVGRAFLRIIIGRYLQVGPSELRFDYGKHGKPSLVKAFTNGRRLEFNLSHSGKLALYAFTCERQIGIDLEQFVPEFTNQEIARRVFSPSEFASLGSLPAVAQERAFFNGWVRKEAFVKAKGDGLSIDLDRFDVTLGPEEPVLFRVGWDEEEAKRWTIKPIEVGGNYVAAVAVEGHDWQLHCWNAGTLAEIGRAAVGLPPRG